MESIKALTDGELTTIETFCEYLVKVYADKPRPRNFWRSITVEIHLERDRRQAEIEQGQEMIGEALGVEGPVEVTWTDRPDLNWDGTRKEKG